VNASAWYRRWLAPGYPDHLREVAQLPVVLGLAGSGLGRVLEIGYGEGLYTAYLLETGDQVVGVDLSPPAAVLTRMRERSRGRLWLLVGDIQALPFGDETFDTVLCTEVIEHVEKDGHALGEASRVLKKGGRLVLSTPIPPAPVPDPAHVREGYHPEQLQRLLAGVGLRVERHECCLGVIARFTLRLWDAWVRGLRLRMPVGVIRLLGMMDLLVMRRIAVYPYDQVLLAVKEGR